MPQIIPIKDLRDTNKISDLCSNSNEPIFVKKNGGAWKNHMIYSPEKGTKD